MNRKSQFFPLGDDNPAKKIPLVNWLLIAANVIIFVLSVSDLEQIIGIFGFTPADFSLLTMFTSMFLHGSIAHLFGNMWFLFIFGDNIEDRLGHIGYVLFYILCGLAATIAHFLLSIGSDIPAIGASGAISGVLGAYLIFFPNAGVYVSGGFGHAGRVSARLMLLVWFGLQLFSSIFTLFGAESVIAFFAHIGGFIFGVIGAIIFNIAARK